MIRACVGIGVYQNGATPLHHACDVGSWEKVARLLERGAAIEARDKVDTAWVVVNNVAQ
jgi:hypothetical protein